jgi:hypothetical protein
MKVNYREKGTLGDTWQLVTTDLLVLIVFTIQLFSNTG